MNLQTHKDKKLTGPYHTIGSLFLVLKKHNLFKKAVKKIKINFCMIIKFINLSKISHYSVPTVKQIFIIKKNTYYKSRKKIEGVW